MKFRFREEEEYEYNRRQDRTPLLRDRMLSSLKKSYPQLLARDMFYLPHFDYSHPRPKSQAIAEKTTSHMGG